MAFNFFRRFQKERKNQQKKALLPTYYMIRIRGGDDLETTNILRTLAKDQRDVIPHDGMYFQDDDSNDDHFTIYFSIYGFEVFMKALKKNIIDHAPVNEEHTQYFQEINVDLSLIFNQFSTEADSDDQGQEKEHYVFQGSQEKKHFHPVNLRADFLSATYFLYQWLFFNYSDDDIADIDVESTYDYLVDLADDLKADYVKEYRAVQGHDIAQENLPTLPSQSDFESQNEDSVYIPSLDDSGEEADTSTPNAQDNDDNDMHDSSPATDDSNQDPTESLTNNSSSSSSPDSHDSSDNDDVHEGSSRDDEDTSRSATEADAPEASHEDTDDRDATADDTGEDGTDVHAKTVGELRREQSASSRNTTDSADEASMDDDDGDDRDDNAQKTPEDVIKRMYAPKIYQMNIQFPQFSIDNDLDEPPDLKEAVKHNDFDDQLYVIQENNHIKKQANEYLQNEAQQLNRNFNYDMGQLVIRSYKRMNDRINAIKREGQDNRELDKAVQRYYDKQSQDAFAELKQHKDQSLDQRLEALKKEYQQKRQDLIAQSDQQYQRDRTNVKTQIQADTSRIRNDNIARRDQDLAQKVQDTKERLEENLNQFLQSKADKYKDMADNLGQRLFTALHNNIYANYPKLVNHVSIMMNDQIQFNYSHKRLDESNANVVKKRLSNYEDRLKQARQEHEDSVNDYEGRIQTLRDRLDQRDDTARGYDKLLTEKNDLQDHLDHFKQRTENQQEQIDKLKKQLDDAPLGQPDMTAKTRSIQLENQSWKDKYRDLENINQESKDRIQELTQELENKKHFWNRK